MNLAIPQQQKPQQQQPLKESSLDRRSASEATEELSGSMQGRISDGDIAAMFPPPTTLKQHVTISTTDSKELDSIFQKRNNHGKKAKNEGTQKASRFSFGVASSLSSSSSHRMSDTRASDIFLRERRRTLYRINMKQSKASFYHADLQKLFEDQELVAALDPTEEFQASSSPSSRKSTAAAARTTTTSLIDDDDEEQDEEDKRCSFGGVEIREYPIIPGDSPAGYRGPPLTIGWKPISTMHVADVDKYEAVRDGHRRNAKEMTLPASHRVEILKNQGFARSEIQKCIKMANIGRRQRKETMSTLKHQATYEKLESFQRTTRNILSFGKKKRDQRKYLKKYVPNYGAAASVATAAPAQ